MLTPVQDTPEIEEAPGAQRLRLSPFALTLPSLFTATFDKSDLPYVIALTLEFDGGRVACKELVCRRRENGAAVTSGGISKVRVAELVHASASRALREESSFVAPGKRRAHTVATAFELPSEPAGRGGPTHGHLRAVGVIYTVAHASGGSPRRAVMDQLQIPRTTANRWIKLARDNGLLLIGSEEDDG